MSDTYTYRREVCLSEYKVQWSDQKISVDCMCGEKEIEIFSESYTYCSKCGRRYAIMEIVQVEVPVDTVESETIDIESDDMGILEYMEKREIGEKSWGG